ncbi:hypothetical protein LTR56_021296 [Elasticomyces elasticus]|nr:hypothetical protein LTR56_021296 [Elasticomyces elasticus]KAK3662160.1 hypothetical protein LTR22_006925 [Elasticomyces elasticus]KAK4916138.1 hypothetical protein LTR49_015779 [Elasticomyces elasticus]KAK5767924.1 hypothetical protein LTS12_001741 [Elasticomyces elasticus]
MAAVNSNGFPPGFAAYYTNFSWADDVEDSAPATTLIVAKQQQQEQFCCTRHYGNRRPNVTSVLQGRNPHLAPRNEELPSAQLGTSPRAVETGQLQRAIMIKTPIPRRCCQRAAHDGRPPLDVTRHLRFTPDLKESDHQRPTPLGTPSGSQETGTIGRHLHLGVASNGKNTRKDKWVVSCRNQTSSKRLCTLRGILIHDGKQHTVHNSNKSCCRPVIQPTNSVYYRAPSTDNPTELRHSTLIKWRGRNDERLARETMNGVHDSIECRYCRRVIKRIGLANMLSVMGQAVRRSPLSDGCSAIQPVPTYSKTMARYGEGQKLVAMWEKM